MKKSAHWRLSVSGETDRRVRRALEALGRRGDLSQFVEECVKAKLLELGADKEPRSAAAAAPGAAEEPERSGSS